MYLISSCLCGVNCKYSGGNNLNKKCLELLEKGEAILVCPEQLGGLGTPRLPAEIRDNKVINKEGIDLTEEFNKGARETLKIAKAANVKKAILKENSPSCGCNFIYDGSFSNKKIEGMGITASLLKSEGIEVISEEDLDKQEENKLIYLSDYDYKRHESNDNEEELGENNIIYSLFQGDGELLVDMPPKVEKQMKTLVVTLAVEMLGLTEVEDIAVSTGIDVEEVKEILEKIKN